MLLRSTQQSFVVHTPAKLNLFLEVLGKRPDGFHELETLMVSVGCYDTLRFEESDAITMSCHWAGAPRFSPGPLPTDDGNLVMRAARLLREVSGASRGVRITLTKRIPVAAGLAGGSSDCAATLVGLNRFWKLGLSANELSELASRLGSDVPFFLAPSATAICRGRGEIIEPVTSPMRLHFVIAKPASGLSTADVFRQCRPTDPPRSVQPLVTALRSGRLAVAARHLHNSLQAPAEILNSDVVRLRRVFQKLPFAGHQMSGSGTSYFGICSQREQAVALAARVRAAGSGLVLVASSQP